MRTLSELRNEVEAAAERLGANRAAVFKWRQRGIPSEWQIKLFGKTPTLQVLRPRAAHADNSPEDPSALRWSRSMMQFQPGGRIGPRRLALAPQ